MRPTLAMAWPGATGRGWLGCRGHRSRGSCGRGTTQPQVRGQGVDQLVTHRPQGAEVGDIVLIQCAAWQDRVLAGEQDIYVVGRQKLCKPIGLHPGPGTYR